MRPRNYLKGNGKMLVAGYIFSAINYIVYCVGRFKKNKSTILIFSLASKLTTLISLYCFGSLSGAYIFAIDIVDTILCNLNEKYQWNIKWIYFITTAGKYIVSSFTFFFFFSILQLTQSTLNPFAAWYLNPQKMRIIGIIGAMCALGQLLLLGNYMGLLEIAVIIANIVSWSKYKNAYTENATTQEA